MKRFATMFLLCALPAFGQSNSGELRLKVTDPSGAVLAHGRADEFENLSGGVSASESDASASAWAVTGKIVRMARREFLLVWRFAPQSPTATHAV